MIKDIPIIIPKDVEYIIETLEKHKKDIFRRDDEEIYKIYFKNKYDYSFYQDIMVNLHDKKLLDGFKADCKLNNISINDIKVDEFFIERKRYLWEKIITPIVTSFLMPIIVSAITTLVTTYLIIKK